MRHPVQFFFLLAILMLKVSAAVQPAALFSNGMVLQRETDASVWGDADPGAELHIGFRGKTVSVNADQKGHWQIQVATGAAGGPFSLEIEGDGSHLTIQDVWVGEVWLASGQSNMERRVGSDDCTSDLEAAQSGAQNPQIHMFTVDRHMQPNAPAHDVRGSWKVAAPNTVRTFSSVGYFFARELAEKLKIPIGIIHSSVGGTEAEAWLQREALDRLPDIAAASRATYQKKNEAYPQQKVDSIAKKLATPPVPVAPSSLYNGMIAPLVPCAIRGVIWYQGEANIRQGLQYEPLLTALIENWRDEWHAPFPFYIVQIAPFRPVVTEPGESDSAGLREAQRQVALKVPASGLVVITDLGNESTPHPAPKRPVGERLAALALRDTYHAGNSAGGPELIEATFENGQARITFGNIGNGLETRAWTKTQPAKDNQGHLGYAWRALPPDQANPPELLDFTICGEDRKFYNAQAKIEGATVVVSSEQVPRPIAVRYGWQEHPIGNLYNSDEVPASPFRTDHFELQKKP